MTDNSQGAIQALVWAIEEIAKTGNKKSRAPRALGVEIPQGQADDGTLV
jgi:hypothetical protein